MEESKEFWDMTFGKDSSLNVAGKILFSPIFTPCLLAVCAIEILAILLTKRKP